MKFKKMIRRQTSSLVGAFLLAATGCSHFMYVTGYSTGDPILQSGPVASSAPAWPAKTWASTSLHTGWEVQGWLGTECDTQMTASCGADGSWSITDHISNRTDAHAFQTGMEFGHIDNHDFKTFVAIATHSTPSITVGSHENKVSSGGGTGDPNIQANFNKINAVRPIVVVNDGVGLPFSFKTVNYLTCTPDQVGN